MPRRSSFPAALLALALAAVPPPLAGADREPDPREHWSFTRPVRPSVPAVANAAWPRNPIDAFVAREHERRGLAPLSEAPRQVLLRRLFLDLVGLPPGPEDLRVFLADESPDAFERVADRLLASPRHGERWGRHWMDVWRYSDWYGRRTVPDVLNSYGQLWRWRDWIVRSLNRDRGYDRMVSEMLAGDEIAPTDREALAATGFIVRNFYRWNYNTWMKDCVEHTAKAFLALTINCSQCHDHKYDPIPQEEYFAFRAFFEPIEIRHDRVPGEPDPGPYPKYSYGASYKPITSGMVRVFDEKLDAETFLYTGGESRNIVAGRPPIAPAAPAALGGDTIAIEPVELPPEAWYPGLQRFVQEEETATREGALAAAERALAAARRDAEALAPATGAGEPSSVAVAVDGPHALGFARVAEAEAQLVAARAELDALRARIEADRARHVDRRPEADELARAAGRAERLARVASARSRVVSAERAVAEAGARPESDAKRSKAITAAEAKIAVTKKALDDAERALEADSTEYTPLGRQYPRRSTGRRTALARWIASDENPLTARVAANHIWLRHLGAGLVATPADFGRNGARPTHPELLDWLAVELVEKEWSMKRLHRLVIASATYRTASSARGIERPEAMADPDNRWLWKFAARQVEAEVVRDAILAVAGELDTTIGGPEIDPALGLRSRRRSLYFAHHGEGSMELLELFDAANPCDCYRRTASVRPQQALALTNSELSLRVGRLLARKLAAEVPGSGDATARRRALAAAAFERTLARAPTPAELETSAAFLARQEALLAAADPSVVAAGAAAGEGEDVPASPEPATRALEGLVGALFSHADFVTMR